MIDMAYVVQAWRDRTGATEAYSRFDCDTSDDVEQITNDLLKKGVAIIQIDRMV